jgi:hypothetical protein
VLQGAFICSEHLWGREVVTSGYFHHWAALSTLDEFMPHDSSAWNCVHQGISQLVSSRIGNAQDYARTLSAPLRGVWQTYSNVLLTFSSLMTYYCKQLHEDPMKGCHICIILSYLQHVS